MTEERFWDLLGLLDWAKTGDDDAVLAPVVSALAEHDTAEIERFEDILAEKLFALDTELHARQIGEHAYVGPSRHFSEDLFLYVRCCVVANGRELYQAVLHDPRVTPKDMEFEALLYLAGQAYERKTGQEFTYHAPISYETFSNHDGWKRRRAAQQGDEADEA